MAALCLVPVDTFAGQAKPVIVESSSIRENEIQHCRIRQILASKTGSMSNTELVYVVGVPINNQTLCTAFNEISLAGCDISVGMLIELVVANEKGACFFGKFVPHRFRYFVKDHIFWGDNGVGYNVCNPSRGASEVFYAPRDSVAASDIAVPLYARIDRGNFDISSLSDTEVFTSTICGPPQGPSEYSDQDCCEGGNKGTARIKPFVDMPEKDRNGVIAAAFFVFGMFVIGAYFAVAGLKN
ncbi:MAG: hypothetical protein JWN16_817 [Alphaproteobacteria bacterium]|nr:hypothetical protein [Alphaproteobacteria bacterium]